MDVRVTHTRTHTHIRSNAPHCHTHLFSWTGANEAVGNMKLFNNHSGSRGLPRFTKGIYWATGLFLRTPFTEGCAGANKKASPPGRHQEQASKQRCTFRPTTFSSVQLDGTVRSSRLRPVSGANHIAPTRLADGKTSLDPVL